MKKFTKLTLTLAMLFGIVGGVSATKLYATYGTPASNGSWDGGTSTYSWTGSYSNLMPIFTFSSGELANYTSINFTTDGYTEGQMYRLFFHGPNKEIAFYSSGVKSIVFANRSEFDGVDLSTVTGISFGGASGSGSIQITGKPYLMKPFTLEFDDSGIAEVNLSDLTASGCFSLNDQTGELTSTYDEDFSNWGKLSINFPVGGVDLSSLTGFAITYTGDNLLGNFEIGNGTKNKGFWSNVTGRDDLNSFMTVDNVGDPTAITLWRWNNNTIVGTMTITSIKLKANVMTASNPHETLLTSAMFVGGCENHFGETVGQGTTIYGNGSVLADQYVDLSAYDEMRIYGTPNKTIRLLFNWSSANQQEITGVSLNSEGYYSLDLSTVAPKQLNAFKFPWDGQSGAITKVVLYKNTVPVPYSYVITGSGAFTPSLTAALADATATSYDATGLTNTSAIELNAINPNCLFIATAGKLSNTKNVIVSDVCANLELTDGKPFKAPAAFTATNAKFIKPVTAAGYATMVIPFTTADLPTGVEAYALTDVDGAKITSKPVDNLAADEPVLIKATENAGYEFTATDAAIAATADGEVGDDLLKASYAGTTAAADDANYVLQNNGEGVNFYRVTGTAATVKPFRAYLQAAVMASPVLYLDFFNGETTGVKAVENGALNAENGFYNLAGQRVAQPTKGLYIVNGKKVVIK